MELMMEGNKTLLEGRNLSAKTGKRILFSGLSFTMKEGEFILVRVRDREAANALLLLLGGLYCFEGSVDFYGTSLNDASDKTAAKIRKEYVAYLREDSLAVPDRTVLWNLRQFVSAPDEELREALKTVGMQGKEAVKAKKLPRLELELLAVARVLAKKPTLLLCDGAALTHNELVEYLKRLNRAGTAVLVCENSGRFEDLADQVLTLET